MIFMYEFGKWDPDFVPTDLKGNYSNFWRFCVGKNGIYAKNDMTSEFYSRRQRFLVIHPTSH